MKPILEEEGKENLFEEEQSKEEEANVDGNDENSAEKTGKDSTLNKTVHINSENKGPRKQVTLSRWFEKSKES